MPKVQTPMEAIRLNPLIPAYKEKFVKDIKKEDIKIAVSGIIVSKDDGKIVIDDTTGNVPVEIKTELEMNKFVRIFGVLIPYDDGFEIQGHIIQDLSEVDPEKYMKVKSLLQ
ncbi:hypothetical protein J4426_02195 [Candidatus Woesearchaeota archaeon]|nr:hypothetical protein [Candidatus Woesearchaeota archaeon]